MTKIRARLGAKGQAVIPKPVRQALDLRPGDTVVFYTHGGHAHVEKEDARAEWDAFFAAFPKKRLPKGTDFDARIEEDLYG